MHRHKLDTPRGASALRTQAFVEIARSKARDPSRVPQFRKAGQTIRSMPLRQYVRILRQQEI